MVVSTKYEKKVDPSRTPTSQPTIHEEKPTPRSEGESARSKTPGRVCEHGQKVQKNAKPRNCENAKKKMKKEKVHPANHLTHLADRVEGGPKTHTHRRWLAETFPSKKDILRVFRAQKEEKKEKLGVEG